MRRILWALSAATALVLTVLVPPASAASVPAVTRAGTMHPVVAHHARDHQRRHRRHHRRRHALHALVGREMTRDQRHAPHTVVGTDATRDQRARTSLETRRPQRAAWKAPIAVVALGASFAPSSVVLSEGEPLLVTVSGDVTATVADPSPGDALAGGALGSSTYLYFGVKPGTTTLSASVGPNCPLEGVCPQWRSAPKLKVTVIR